MKESITIGVIAVIATILVTSAVDYSAIGAKPIDQIHLELSGGLNEGTIVCPNGNEIDTNVGSLSYTEHIGEFLGGGFDMTHTTFTIPPPDLRYSGNLHNGEVQSDKFSFAGIGSADDDLAGFCNDSVNQRSTFVVWGECGNNVTVHFESEEGYSGSFTGNVLCV